MGIQQVARGAEISGAVEVDLAQSATPGQEDARLTAQRESGPATFDVAFDLKKAVGKEAVKLLGGDDKKEEEKGRAPGQSDPSILLNSGQVNKALEEYRTRLEALPEDQRAQFNKALLLIEARQAGNGGVLDAKNELKLIAKLMELRELTKDSAIESAVLFKKDGQIALVDRARGQVTSLMDSGQLTEDQSVDRLTELNSFDRVLRPKKGEGKAAALNPDDEMKLLKAMHNLFDKPAGGSAPTTQEGTERTVTG